MKIKVLVICLLLESCASWPAQNISHHDSITGPIQSTLTHPALLLQPPPGDLKVSVQDQEALLSWSDLDTNLSLTSYEVLINPPNTITTLEPTSNQLKLTLSPGDYTFKVRAKLTRDDLKERSHPLITPFSNGVSFIILPPLVTTPKVIPEQSPLISSHPVPASAPPPLGCSAAFWYPRFNICMNYNYYTDCTGKTSQAFNIISIDTCFDKFGGNYLLGHNSLPWGNIRYGTVGDEIRLNGLAYHVTGSYTTPTCTGGGGKFVYAKVHMDTSTSYPCSDAFVLMAN